MLGNSLTNDSIAANLRNAFLGDHVDMYFGNQVRGSATLTGYVETPVDGSSYIPAPWPTAFATRAWSFITFQSAIGTGRTLGQEHDSLETLAAAVKAGPSGEAAELYLYEGWPRVDLMGSNYQTYWDGAVVDADATDVIAKKAYFDLLLARARSTIDADFHVIPTGEVFRAIDVAARAGQLAGFTQVQDGYRDTAHAGDVLRFAAGATIYCVLRKHPLDDSFAWTYYDDGGGSIRINEALAAQIADIVWDVVSTDPRTGVTP